MSSGNGKHKPAVQLPPELVERLKARDGTFVTTKGRPSEIPVEPLRKAASRYFALIEKELAAIDLSVSEASLICDALNGVAIWDWGCIGSLPAGSTLCIELADAVNPAIGGLAGAHGVDGDLFLAKVGQWNEAQCLAVLDAAERFWADYERATVESVGLVKE